MSVDLSPLYDFQHTEIKQGKKIRERINAGARFSTSRDGQHISHIAIWTGKGRDRKERRINLSIPQGKFLFHLPFPGAEPMEIKDIMKRAAVDEHNHSEIQDIVNVLIEYGVIESS
jgi:hypothetical protein